MEREANDLDAERVQARQPRLERAGAALQPGVVGHSVLDAGGGVSGRRAEAGRRREDGGERRQQREAGEVSHPYRLDAPTGRQTCARGDFTLS